MGLSIFSFDLAALINSLSQIMDSGAADEQIISDIIELAEAVELAAPEINSVMDFSNDSMIEEILLATTISNAVIQTVAPEEVKEKPVSKVKKETPVKTPITSIADDEEYKKAIEQLIRSLQTSATYSYQSADIINEKVSLKNIANFPRRKNNSDNEKTRETLREETKSREAKLEKLRDELKKARMSQHRI